jgi:hypothetical protein
MSPLPSKYQFKQDAAAAPARKSASKKKAAKTEEPKGES